MDVYHIWCNLKDSREAAQFCADVDEYLSHLKENAGLGGFRILRCKLGLGPAEIGEFHIMLEFENLAELDRSFSEVSMRIDPVESLHRAVYTKVNDLTFALYPDFPDTHERK